MQNNQGWKIEKEMRQWFRGRIHPSNCVDFQTTKALYEVKSCKLFNECTNGNHKRPYKIKPHKKIVTTQMGRFMLRLESHNNLRACAKKENKIPKYIFVVVIGKQKIWRVKSWKQINLMVCKKSEVTIVRIKDLFNETWEES